MKIVTTKVVLELPETLELGTAKILCEKPYRIERVESDNGDVIWYGFNTNWQRYNNVWYELIGYNFVECDIPEYELLYLGLNIKKLRKEKIEKIEKTKTT